MKKFLTLLAASLLVVTATSAQNSQKIIGNWAYVDLHDKSEMDETTLQIAEMLFQELSISFRPDNTLSLTMRKTPETGTYTFDVNNEAIVNAVSATGKEMKLQIVSLTDDELIVKLDQLGAMRMKKTSDEPDAAPPIVPKVSATKKQITGKWYINKVGDKQMSEMAAELMKDSYIEFAVNGDYKAKILSAEQNGTWTFGEGNTTIDVDTEDGAGIWSIYAISDNELKMQNDTSVKVMTFSRKQL